MKLEIPDELEGEFVSFLEFSVHMLESQKNEATRKEDYFTKEEERLLDIIREFVKERM
jgi:hypothetical protein